MRRTFASPGSTTAGISLLEVLAAVCILIVLASLIITAVTPNLRRAEGVRCTTNLRNLHVVFHNYVQENGHWPQEPENIAEDDVANDDWWMNETKNYGGTDEIWTCPSIRRLVQLKSSNGRPKMHYTPTPFDELPMTPYKWNTMPWLLEIGNMHGNGALGLFSDGSVRPMNEFAPTKK